MPGIRSMEKITMKIDSEDEQDSDSESDNDPWEDLCIQVKAS